MTRERAVTGAAGRVQRVFGGGQWGSGTTKIAARVQLVRSSERPDPDCGTSTLLPPLVLNGSNARISGLTT